MTLADKIERAEAGSRELDKEVAVIRGFCLHPFNRQERSGAQSDTGFTCLDCGGDSWGTTGPSGQKFSDPLPHYTTSIDAAMTLVNSEWGDWSLSRDSLHGIEAAVWACKSRYIATGDAATCHQGYHSTSPALALCAAAIRAGDGNQ